MADLVAVWCLQLVAGLSRGFVWQLPLRILRLGLLAGLMVAWILGAVRLLGSGWLGCGWVGFDSLCLGGLRVCLVFCFWVPGQVFWCLAVVCLSEWVGWLVILWWVGW